jgi:hypothetical protein
MAFGTPLRKAIGSASIILLAVAGCDYVEELLHRGSVRGVESCIAANKSQLVAPDLIRAACIRKHAHPLPSKLQQAQSVSGAPAAGGSQPAALEAHGGFKGGDATHVFFVGELINRSAQTQPPIVVTGILIEVTHVDNPKHAEKKWVFPLEQPETEPGPAALWIAPGTRLTFEAADLEFAPALSRRDYADGTIWSWNFEAWGLDFNLK